MKRTLLLGLLTALAASAGCLDIIGYFDPTVGDPFGTSGTGATGGTGGTGGVSTTTLDTGGTGGTGGSRFACNAVSATFDILTATDIPDANLTSGQFFIVPEPGVLPPRAHVVAFESNKGQLLVRTVRQANQLGPVAVWQAPGGYTRFTGGFATSDQVLVDGSFQDANVSAVGEIAFAKNEEKLVTGAPAPQVMTFARPAACDAAAVAFRALFAHDDSGVACLAGWDDCAPGARRIYRCASAASELVREGDKTAASLALADFTRAGTTDIAVFSDYNETFYSFGQSAAALGPIYPVALGADPNTITVPVAMAPLPPNGVLFAWGAAATPSLLPATVLTGAVALSTLDQAAQISSYSVAGQFNDFGQLTRWSKPFALGDRMVTGGVAADSSAVRFSVIGVDGKVSVLNQDVILGQAGEFLEGFAVPFGAEDILIAWIRIDQGSYTVQGRLFLCE